MNLLVNSFDYIVMTQEQLPGLFTRVSAGNYKIKNGIKTVYIKKEKGSGSADANKLMAVGNYELSDVLSGGDSASTGIKIFTNDCTYFFCEPGTQFDWDNIKCQWLIEKKEFVGENCQNFGNASLLNIEDASGNPTTGYVVSSVFYDVSLISSKVADGGEGGGLLKNWLFSGYGQSGGYSGDTTDYLNLQNCKLRGCQVDDALLLTGFSFCKGNNIVSIGNNLEIGETSDSKIFDNCKQINNIFSLNDGYAMDVDSKLTLFDSCSNINNIEVDRFLYAAGSDLTSVEIFNLCKRFNNIEITDALYNFSGAANVIGFDTCSFFSNIEIDSMGYAASNSGTFIIFDTCKHFNNLELTDIMKEASGGSSFIIFNNCEFFNNFEATDIGLNRTTFTAVALIATTCSFISNGKISGFFNNVTTAVNNYKLISSSSFITAISIINSVNNTPAATIVNGFFNSNYLVGCSIISVGSNSTVITSAGFIDCNFLSSCSSDGSSGTTAAKDYNSCDFIASCSAGGSGTTYWGSNTNYCGQGVTDFSTNS